tara:strand:+ start:2587 stop:2994 length:408 start_codon:yes stop_codon:yes gene_type:complete
MPPKPTIGPTAQLYVKEAGFDYLARIDTGARISSIHAFDIQLRGSALSPMHLNKGKKILFSTENHQGRQARIEAIVIDVPVIRTPVGSEERYIVELVIGDYRVHATLRDRSQMDYKLLIGRNWLEGHYLVDVDLF